MKAKKITIGIFLGLMALAFTKVGIETLIDPQSTMDQVGIELTNASASSSMRAVYGGLHLVFGIFCLWGAFYKRESALGLVCLYTLGYTIGRVSGIVADGAPNEFITSWIMTEAISGLLAGGLLVWLRQPAKVAGNVQVA
ncbi:DUF4345 domain-containing protein [Cesiribacter andamanensis]|uniref:DUF4345 domain-containing protein n=1 Tax=Cesiribacter andamanensis AMV16 TaxID=1279009 RepID=M7NJD1_9BACT|nr:DUF4345 domain-containing protein [Cesiribacter andamanensis]EMR01890.1 hypothetical protein ADICEAN_02959 [Cesiribacter andamanensis AMV16]